MRVLKLGSTGTYVETLQTALNRAGFGSTEPDGIFGPRTQANVLRFQEQNGLFADGIVGPLTWARLKPYLTGYITHTVARGDTFFILAERYNTTVNAISTANSNVNPLNIPIGSQLVIPLGFRIVPTNISYSYFLLSNIVEGLLSRYPFIRGGSIGNSVMGRELFYIRIGNGQKQVAYNAAHHANEWITTPILLNYIEELSLAYSTNGTIYGENVRELLSKVMLFVVPMVNPDGVDLVTGALSSDNGFYKQAQTLANNYPDIPFPSGWKANISGTDLNLNYPANWDLARDIKVSQGYTTPAPRDFVGEEPLSAIESSAMYTFTIQNAFDLTLSYHSQGEVIFWKYLDYEPERSYDIGRAFADASGYELLVTPPESAYAGYKDWFIQAYNRPGYTIEVGSGTNPLPISQFSNIYRDNVGILTLGMKLA